MKRDVLEGLEWHTGEDEGANGSGGPFIYAPEMDDEEGMKLAAAAPALALACLKSLTLVQVAIGTGIVAEDGLPGECREQLTAALKLAGVEVSDEG